MSSVAFIAFAVASPAHAQDAAAAAPVAQDAQPTEQESAADEIVVTGLRSSLSNAANLKRTSNQIQDSIVAEDIGKLPDTNIAELMQRIPGVQIARNTRGEGNGYVVHGLKQVMTTVNGRQLFTVTNRSATLLDFSADILSGLDVYKTATADQIEGGLGGLINIHTARPFDFKGFHLSATGSGAYSEFQDKISPRLSGVVSDRFETGAGEIGVLFGGQYERVYSGGYQVSTNAYANTTSLYDRDGDGTFNATPADAGDTVQIPSQIRPRYETGDRVRSTIYGAVQWAPSPDLTFHADVTRSHSGGHSFTQQISVQADAQTRGVPSSFVYKDAPNGDVPDSYTLTNALVRSVTGASDNPYNTTSVGVGFDWHSGALTLSGEGAYVDSSGPFYSRSIAIQTRAPTATVDLSGRTPTVDVTGVDLTSASSYTGAVTYSDLGQQSSGREPSFRLDAKYEVNGGPITGLMAGVRYARHRAINDVYSISPTVTLTQPLASVTELTPNDLFTNQNQPISQWLAISDRYIKDATETRALAGVPLVDQPYPLTNHYNYLENVWALYGEAEFAFNLGVPIDGNLGLRYVSTKNQQSVYDATLRPVEGEASYNNWLPSVNVRAKFTPNLFLRLAYSKAITRPDFGNLSPALVLNALSETGSGGNPDLQPTKADQYDLSLEYYFGKSNYLAGALFQKNVTGFVQKFSVDEVIDGTTYSISRPRNTGSGKIKGFEITYQQFFDFLPSFLSGLGFQGNYTYVDSSLPVVGQSITVPADLLSKNSYNLTGIYEKGPISLHVSYNWRSKSVQTNFSDNFGRTLWNAPQDSLDFSATYSINQNVQLKFDVVNLTTAYQFQYYGSPDLPTVANQLDRSYQMGIHVNF
ncbi:TonB-dependent receptor [Sphingomonas sp. dw_22]|uniref:TonB-dependent receptor n=1 Tax=Sphingomonas sp. dw_22 TaxID=2721175 RepID=UPI001BD31A05|nr:TonB-dependent receptor [Sphingomonas sp. dw_22]